MWRKTRLMIASVSFPEIYLCDFPFPSGTQSKKRP
jgi:hypothetical protein